jgi:hypothetical protein
MGFLEKLLRRTFRGEEEEQVVQGLAEDPRYQTSTPLARAEKKG